MQKPIRLASSENRDEWLSSRRNGVTATDVATLAHGGVEAWKRLKLQKADGSTTPVNKYMQWGIDREPVIAKNVADQLGTFHNTHLFACASDERWLATPDLLHPAGTLVGDIKTAVGEPWEDMPPRYRDQLQWQMLVMDADEGVIVAEFHEDFFPVETRHYWALADYDRQQELISLAEQFLTMDSPHPIDVYLADYARADAALKAAKADLDEARRMIEKQLDADGMSKYVSDVGSATLTTPKPTARVDAKRLSEEHPGLASRYITMTDPKPRLTVRPAKEAA